MSLNKEAQLFIEEEPIVVAPFDREEIVIEPSSDLLSTVFDTQTSPGLGDPHQHGHIGIPGTSPGEEVEIYVEELPGVDMENLDPVEEHKLNSDEIEVFDDNGKKQDENDAKKKSNKKKDKWSWEDDGAKGFLSWVKTRLSEVPKHSGYSDSGLERAMAYLEKLNNEISKAMRQDIDGELDDNKVEEVRSEIEDGIDRLQARLDKVSAKKKRKKKADGQEDIIVKEAQKIYGVNQKGVVITVPLLTLAIARACVNAVVTNGKDMRDTFHKLADKWKLTDRERLECSELINELGYPLPFTQIIDDGFDPSSTDNSQMAANYPA